MALAIMKKTVVQEPDKTTLPTVTVTGIRKKMAPKYQMVQKGKKTFSIIDMEGEKTNVSKEEFQKITGKKQ
jgi:hypothetical protein